MRLLGTRSARALLLSAGVEEAPLEGTGNLSIPMLESKVADVLKTKSTINVDEVSKIRSKDELDNN